MEQLQVSIDMAWTLVAAFLVFLMQAGFALLGAGMVRVKNTANYLTKSYMDFSIGAFVFLLVGFALMFGGSGGAPGLEAGNRFLGTSGFVLLGEAAHPSTAMYFIFQMMFAATAATIVAGMVSERLKFGAYLVYTVVITAFIYPIYGHWVWGGGWLSELPVGPGGEKIAAVDFAGSGVVHAVGGLVGLMAAYLLGPRIGKYNSDGTPNRIPGHNLTYIVTGTFLLFFGWFGFNAGSTLSATDPVIAIIATNTFLAGSAGAVAVIAVQLLRGQKPGIGEGCNGALAGLVGITAPCAFVAPWASLVIGLVAGIIYMAAAHFIEWKLKIDDPVGAGAVHGVNGLWGLIAVGIFADGSYGGVTGLIAGKGHQLLAQLISAGTVLVWALATGFVLFWIIDAAVGLRVSKEEELGGLDLSEHGLETYPEFPEAVEFPLPMQERLGGEQR
ncbi:MAG: ammonium transporter [Candidatus Bipolaricaulia bacterium]